MGARLIFAGLKLVQLQLLQRIFIVFLAASSQQRIQDANLAAEDTAELRTLFAKCTGDNTKYLLYRDMMRRVCARIAETTDDRGRFDDESR